MDMTKSIGRQDTEYYKCNNVGHPVSSCKSTFNNNDDKSPTIMVSSVNKLKRDLKSMKKEFDQLKEAHSDLSESEDEEETLHFLFDEAHQFVQIKLSLIQKLQTSSDN